MILMLTLGIATTWGEVSVDPGAELYPREGSAVPIGWEAEGLKLGLDTEARGKILCPRRRSNPGSLDYFSKLSLLTV
jgi:hypothetical protein